MAASVWTFYDSVPYRIGTGDIDLDTDTFKVAFLTSSYTPSAAHDTYADLTNELTTANGYTSGGVTTTMTTTGNLTVDLQTSDVTATGNITFRYMVLYDSTTNYLVAYCLADSTPADYTISSGNVWNFTDSSMWTVAGTGSNDWQMYENTNDFWWAGSLELDTATLKMALFTTTYTPNVGTSGDSLYSALSNELASGDGYTTGGVTLSKTWTDIGSGVAELDLSAAATWTFTADKSYRYAVIYDNATSILLCVADLTGGGNDTCNNTLTINASVSGILRGTK